MTTDRNALGHTLVRFYLAHGSVLPFLDTLTVREIYNTCESGMGVVVGMTCEQTFSISSAHPSTLFRGNSLASKSFDQFMKVCLNLQFTSFLPLTYPPPSSTYSSLM